MTTIDVRHLPCPVCRAERHNPHILPCAIALRFSQTIWDYPLTPPKESDDS